jgi:hypothetical protein
MKTLNAETVKIQLNACGVKVNDISSDLKKIVEATVSSSQEAAFIEAKINAIRLDLAAKDSDFNPKDIFFSFSPLPRSVIVYKNQPFIVDCSHKNGLFLISMCGEEYENAPVAEYPVIGTITI